MKTLYALERAHGSYLYRSSQDSGQLSTTANNYGEGIIERCEGRTHIVKADLGFITFTLMEYQE